MGRLAGTATAPEDTDTYYHYDEVGNRKWLCIDADNDFDGSDPTNPTGYEINFFLEPMRIRVSKAMLVTS